MDVNTEDQPGPPANKAAVLNLNGGPKIRVILKDSRTATGQGPNQIFRPIVQATTPPRHHLVGRVLEHPPVAAPQGHKAVAMPVSVLPDRTEVAQLLSTANGNQSPWAALPLASNGHENTSEGASQAPKTYSNKTQKNVVISCNSWKKDSDPVKWIPAAQARQSESADSAAVENLNEDSEPVDSDQEEEPESTSIETSVQDSDPEQYIEIFEMPQEEEVLSQNFGGGDDEIARSLLSEPQLGVAHRPLFPLEWHIKQSQRRSSGVNGPPNKTETVENADGLIQLEISKGRIDSREKVELTPIQVLEKVEVCMALEFDINLINRLPDSQWKPTRRNQRVRSVEHTNATDNVSGATLKRKWNSLNFDLDLDDKKNYKKIAIKSLICEETIVDQSSDGNSEHGDPGADSKGDIEAAGRNSGAVFEPLDPKIEPMNILEQEWEYSPLEEAKDKVRECFRPLEMSGREPNGLDFINWEDGVGKIYGSRLSFCINEFGLVDLKSSPQAGGSDGEESLEQLDGRPYEINRKTDFALANVSVNVRKSKVVDSGFWDRHMSKRGTFPAPQYMFKHLKRPRHDLTVGMQLEVIDPTQIHQTRVAHMVKDLGGRFAIRIKDLGVRYYNANSWELLPVGFAKAMGMSTYSSGDYRRILYYENDQLLRNTKRYTSRFKVGWQLEAIDCKGSGNARAAFIHQIIGNHLLITFDGDVVRYGRSRLPKTSFWCSDDSPLIRPIQPKKFVKEFQTDWRQHLENRRTVAAPTNAFKTRSTAGFKEGMQLEVVDRINPFTLRPATVTAVKGYELQISYDTFPNGESSFSLWVWDDSEDLYPIEWSSRNNHLLTTPEAKVTCQTWFCRNVGSRFIDDTSHTTSTNCPYRLPAYFLDDQRDPDLASRMTRFPKILNKEEKHVSEDEARDPATKDDIIALLEWKLKKKSMLLNNCVTVADYGPSVKQNYRQWKKHTQTLTKSLPNDHLNPLLWTPEQVRQYINSLPDCTHLGDFFVLNEINGEALLSMTEEDLLESLHLKKGISIKIFNAILCLRVNVLERMRYKYVSST